jgi:hypothetical protein
LVALLAGYAGFAHSAIVTVNGANVSFTYDDSTLYGTGFVVGDSIFFTPTDFRAESADGAGFSTASATLNIGIQALRPDYSFTQVALLEQGDYFLSGGSASVAAGGRLQVASLTTSCSVFPCIDSETFNVSGLGTVGALTDWTSEALVDFGDTAGWVSDTNVTAQIQNNLSAATANSGELAFIQKKAQLVGLTVVPVPAAIWLFISGLGMLIGASRVRR